MSGIRALSTPLPDERMLSLRSVRKSYGERRVLAAVDLDLGPGEYLAVMGESGAGKSTLLNLISGLDTPDGGVIRFQGQDLGNLSDDELTLLRRQSMGFVFQAFHVLPYLTVEQNVALPLVLNGAARSQIAARVGILLEHVGLADRAGSLPRQLSGGEIQRIAIARALVHRPRLILADEPTGNLDAETGAQVLELLKRCVKEERAAGILVTHSADAARTADRTVRLTPHGVVAV